MKYYCVKQHDITDCGYKLKISKIRDIAGTLRCIS